MVVTLFFSLALASMETGLGIKTDKVNTGLLSNRANLLKLNGHFALLWLSKFDFQISLRIVSSLS